MDNYIVYQTTNLVSGKIYVGIHKQKGKSFDGYYGSGVELKKALIEYGEDNFIREILFIEDSEEVVQMIERAIVNKWFVLQDWNYNKALGGFHLVLMGDHNGFYGKTHSDEFKRKMSKIHKGKIIPDELRKRWSETRKGTKVGENNPMYGLYGSNNPNYGSKRTEEQKRNISESKKGCKVWITGKRGVYSEQTLKAMSDGHKNLGNCCTALLNANKEPIIIFKSRKEAGDMLGVPSDGISRVCNGILKSTYGFTFMNYKEV